MEIATIIEKLKVREEIKENPFQIAKAISFHYNNSTPQSIDRVQDLVLRAMEHYQDFGGSKFILDSLIRQLGLFPYLNDENLSIREALAKEAHKIKIEGEEIYFHRPQAEIYYKILQGKSVVLSAPTSFGKSLIIDALIASKKFNNIVIIVPTISLIDETRRRLAKFSSHFKIITHSLQSKSDKNVFVLTQERALEDNFIEEVDFFVIDEFYKLSPWADSGNRCSLLNEAFYRLYKKCSHFYMLGPNISNIENSLIKNVRFEFIKFGFNTVVTEFHNLIPNKKEETLTNLCKDINGQTIVFCSSPSKANSTARNLANNTSAKIHSDAKSLSNWLQKNYHSEWVLAKALQNGIGIHHARIPRSISQYIIDLFNTEKIKFLICTSTLIEGINTSAKNIICYDNKINRSNINYFTFCNIAGRSGRMFKHFIGNVYLLSPPPTEQLTLVDIPAYSQGPNTPESLLINMDETDLSKESRERIKPITLQNSLDIQVIRTNKTIDPNQQIEFARELDRKYDDWINNLLWRGHPSYEQLSFICHLIWEFFNGSKIGNRSVVSSKQLTYKIKELSEKKTTPKLIAQARAHNETKNIDEIISDILDFKRLWANFHFPRFLRAIESIVNSIQKSKTRNTYCDYSAYSILVENYFYDPSLVALEEYGLPLEIASKFEKDLSFKGDLDKSLKALTTISSHTHHLSDIEKKLLQRASFGTQA